MRAGVSPLLPSTLKVMDILLLPNDPPATRALSPAVAGMVTIRSSPWRGVGVVSAQWEARAMRSIFSGVVRTGTGPRAVLHLCVAEPIKHSGQR